MSQQCMLLLLSLLMPVAAEREKVRPPDPERQLAAEHELKERFGRALLRTPDEKVKRAKDLLDEAGRTRVDYYRYVLYRSAMCTAAEAGAIEIALQARKGLAEDYDVNEMDLNKDLWSRVPIQMADKRRQVAIELSDLCLMSLQLQLTRCSFDAASVVLNESKLYVKESKNDWLLEELRDFEKELEFRRKEQKSHLQAAERLKSDPSDPSANFTCGRFLCLLANSWKEGLPPLQKGSDPLFRTLAEAEIGEVVDVKGKLQLAETWLKAEERAQGRWKIPMCRRARYWCEKVFPDARGDRRTKTEKLLNQIEEEENKFATPKTLTWKYFSQVAGNLKVTSAGYGCGNLARISFKGKDLLVTSNSNRGINIVIFRRGLVKSVSHFDTHARTKDSQEFADAIKAMHRGEMAAITVCDEAVDNFTENAQKAIESIGGRLGLYKQKSRCSYYCIGFKGMAKGQAIEKLEPNKKIDFPSKG